jgi:ketosteroid isomerase-like protein
MSAFTPPQVHELFARYFSDGNLEGLVALYEPTAVLLPQPGQQAIGPTAIKEALAGFLAMKGSFRMSPIKVVPATDIAMLFSDWCLDGEDQDGNPIRLSGQTADVVRRQADGCWLFVIDSPFGAAGVVQSVEWPGRG